MNFKNKSKYNKHAPIWVHVQTDPGSKISKHAPILVHVR